MPFRAAERKNEEFSGVGKNCACFGSFQRQGRNCAFGSLFCPPVHASTDFHNSNANQLKGDTMKIKNTLALITMGYLLSATWTFAQSTAFTYQGQVTSSGVPVSGTYNLTFSLLNAASGGTAIAGPVGTNGVLVNNGFFTVTIDFGAGVWNGQTNWLQIGVETNGAASFTSLAPRQQILPVPYAVFANSASNLLGALPAIQLSGTVPLPQLPAGVVTNNETADVTLDNLTLDGTLNLPAAPVTVESGGSLLLRADSNDNFFVGPGAGNLTTTGYGNTASGAWALDNNTVGSYDTANGVDALYANTNGYYDTANGFEALFSNTSGSGNTANGAWALYFNTNGYYNTANGCWALDENTSGFENTANGAFSLYYNTIGFFNTANGSFALYRNISGSQNTANGTQSLYSNTNGYANTANGATALYDNTTGFGNTANGASALYSNTSGNNNTADGNSALANLGGNVAGGTNNIALGYLAGSAFTANESSNIDIGNVGVAGESGVIRMGSSQSATYLAGVINGNGGGLTNLNVSQSSGAISLVQLPSAVVTNNESASVTLDNLSLSGTLNLPAAPVTVASGGGLLLRADSLDNFFAGIGAGNLTTSGTYNTAVGGYALESNTSGYNNTGNGFEALCWNQSGYNNTANGSGALCENTSGYDNAADGDDALGVNTNGTYNTANGVSALYNNTSGSYNTANGCWALNGNTTGAENTATGLETLDNSRSGNYNTADGSQALKFLGADTLAGGTNNIALGYLAGSALSGNESSNIDIGNFGVAGESKIIRIGVPGIQTATYLPGTVYANGVALTSDRNAKEHFTAIDPQAVLAKVATLPITEWNYKDDKTAQHIGPMAQDFHAEFGLCGTDDKHISVLDENGVTLAAIQGLNQKLNEKDAVIQKQSAQIQQLQQSVAELRAMVSQLAQRRPGNE
jgi:trimeric autotransporter adhesin